MKDSLKSTGAVGLIAGGIASAFALATCCALPFFLGSAALVFAPIAVASEPHSQLLTAISVVGLLGGIGVAARAPKHCEASAVCARPWFRWSIFIGALIGLVLLVLAKAYA
ncbi:MAG: mercuric reductase [Sphingomicrobium sp.]